MRPVNYKPDTRVYIHPIREYGTVSRCRADEKGQAIFEVARDSDGENHLCRANELSPVRSFVAKYHRLGKGTLIGGVRSGRSSRFQRRSDAKRILSTTIELNGPENCAGEVCESFGYPEILLHCHPEIAQAVGGCCFRCKEVVKEEHAKEAKAIYD